MKMETKKQPKILWPATRQYKHNDGSDGFVMGYDINVVDKIVESLQSKLTEANKTISELREENKELESFNEHILDIYVRCAFKFPITRDWLNIELLSGITPPTETSKDDSERGEG